MKERRIILVSVICLLVTVLAVETLSQTRRRPLRRPSRAAPQRAAPVARRPAPRPGADTEDRVDLTKGYLNVKYACKASDEQWEVLKAKLHNIGRLRRQAYVGVQLTLNSASSSEGRQSGSRRRSAANWRWVKRWEDESPSELIEAEKIVDKIIRRLEASSANEKELTELMAALRGTKQAAQKQLLKAKEELRDGLTVRQEAALVLLGWL